MIEKLTSKVSLNINGKNINRFIKKLIANKVDILKLKYKSKNEVNIIIYKKDLKKVQKIKSIYDITELEVFGILKIKRNIYKNKHLLVFLLACFSLFMVLTNMIFSIEIIHSNKDVRNLIKRELNKSGIKKYSFKKSYDEIEKIKENILNKYKDKIEWLEVESFGTKYIVRAEERKIPEKNIDDKPRNIIAGKKGVIKKVIAEKGDIVKDMDDYVEKGELVITGDLMFNNELKGTVRAEGKVYAEIWYVTKVEYPYIIEKKIKTGNNQNIYSISFLNKPFEITLHRFKDKDRKISKIFSHPLLPIFINKEKQEEIKRISEVLTFDEALERAKVLAHKKMKNKLRKGEYIIRSNYLKSTVKKSTIEVEMFFAVYEDITDYQEIG